MNPSQQPRGFGSNHPSTRSEGHGRRVPLNLSQNNNLASNEHHSQSGPPSPLPPHSSQGIRSSGANLPGNAISVHHHPRDHGGPLRSSGNNLPPNATSLLSAHNSQSGREREPVQYQPQQYQPQQYVPPQQHQQQHHNQQQHNQSSFDISINELIIRENASGNSDENDPANYFGGGMNDVPEIVNASNIGPNGDGASDAVDSAAMSDQAKKEKEARWKNTLGKVGQAMSYAAGSGKDLLGISALDEPVNRSSQRKSSYSSQGRLEAGYLPFKNKREKKEFGDYIDLLKDKYQLTHHGDTLLALVTRDLWNSSEFSNDFLFSNTVSTADLGIITFAQLHAYKTAIPDENVLFLFTASYHKHVLRFDYPDATVDDVCQGHDLRLAVDRTGEPLRRGLLCRDVPGRVILPKEEKELVLTLEQPPQPQSTQVTSAREPKYFLPASLAKDRSPFNRESAADRGPPKVAKDAQQLEKLCNDLCTACWNNELATVKTLLADPDVKLFVNSFNARGQTPLYCACRQGALQVVLELLTVKELDMDVQMHPHHGTALHAASFSCHHEIVAQMLYAGANPALQNSLGLTPGQEAVKEEVQALFELVAREGPDGLKKVYPNMKKRTVKHTFLDQDSRLGGLKGSRNRTAGLLNPTDTELKEVELALERSVTNIKKAKHQGWLIKEGASSNRMVKRVYCVLDSDFFYTFESDVAKKPLTIAYLKKYSAVEAWIFADPVQTQRQGYGFKITDSALILPPLLYSVLKANEKDAWIEAIQSVFSSYKNCYSSLSIRREINIYLKIAEAKFSFADSEEKKDTFCVVYAGHNHVARTPTIYHSKTPLFAEEYDFDGEKVTALTIAVRQLRGNKIIGQAKIPINEELDKKPLHDVWLKLYPVANDLSSTSICLIVAKEESTAQQPLPESNLCSLTFQPVVIQGVKGDVYAQVTIDGQFAWKSALAVVQKEKKSKKNTAPSVVATWPTNEKFTLTSGPTSQINVEVWRQSAEPGRAPEFIGEVVFIPQDLSLDNNNKKQWYELRERESVVVDPNIKPVGDLRVTVERKISSILSDKEYDKVFLILTENDLELTKKLAAISKQKEKSLAEALVKAFNFRRSSVNLVVSFLKIEVENTAKEGVIFRENSVATKAVEMYMRLVGMSYLHNCFKDIILQIWQNSSGGVGKMRSCELDLTRMEETDEKKKQKQAEKNSQILIGICEQILSTVMNSFRFCPSSFRTIFHAVANAISLRFPAETSISRYTGPSGLIWLRFFCPAILTPKNYGLIDEQPSPAFTRDLTIIGKVLQNLANFVEFGKKEEHMGIMNPWINKKKAEMKQFLTKLCTLPLANETIDDTPVKQDPLQWGREMGRIHLHILEFKNELVEQYGLYDPQVEKLLGWIDSIAETEGNDQSNDTQIDIWKGGQRTSPQPEENRYHLSDRQQLSLSSGRPPRINIPPQQQMPAMMTPPLSPKSPSSATQHSSEVSSFDGGVPVPSMPSLPLLPNPSPTGGDGANQPPANASSFSPRTSPRSKGAIPPPVLSTISSFSARDLSPRGTGSRPGPAPTPQPQPQPQPTPQPGSPQYASMGKSSATPQQYGQYGQHGQYREHANVSHEAPLDQTSPRRDDLLAYTGNTSPPHNYGAYYADAPSGFTSTSPLSGSYNNESQSSDGSTTPQQAPLSPHLSYNPTPPSYQPNTNRSQLMPRGQVQSVRVPVSVQPPSQPQKQQQLGETPPSNSGSNANPPSSQLAGGQGSTTQWNALAPPTGATQRSTSNPPVYLGQHHVAREQAPQSGSAGGSLANSSNATNLQHYHQQQQIQFQQQHQQHFQQQQALNQPQNHTSNNNNSSGTNSNPQMHATRMPAQQQRTNLVQSKPGLNATASNSSGTNSNPNSLSISTQQQQQQQQQQQSQPSSYITPPSNLPHSLQPGNASPQHSRPGSNSALPPEFAQLKQQHQAQSRPSSVPSVNANPLGNSGGNQQPQQYSHQPAQDTNKLQQPQYVPRPASGGVSHHNQIMIQAARNNLNPGLNASQNGNLGQFSSSGGGGSNNGD